MTRDEWILANLKTVEQAVKAWGRYYTIARSAVDDIYGESMVRLVTQASQIEAAGEKFPTSAAYASSIVRNTIVDYMRAYARDRHEFQGHRSIMFDSGSGQALRRSTSIGHAHHDSGFSTVYSDFNAPQNEYRSSESDLPLSAEFTCEELAVIEAYVDRVSKDGEPWQRARAKRRVLHLLEKLEIHAGPFRQYAPRRPACRSDPKS